MENYLVQYGYEEDNPFGFSDVLFEDTNTRAGRVAVRIGRRKISAESPREAYERFVAEQVEVLPIKVVVWRYFAARNVFDDHVEAAKIDNIKLIPCTDCGKEISRSATACPQCGNITAEGREEERFRREEEFAQIQANAANQKNGMPLVVQFAALGFIIIFVLPFLGKSCAP